jgi:threonine aldolase
VKPIDLRSDTVTLPTPAMREAMARAEVGDDVYGEDPTVRRLEARVAELLGKEAALFFPSGTMANQASLHALTRPGDVVAAAAGAHVLKYEGGAAAALAGVQIHQLGSDGRFGAEDVRAALPPADPHYAPLSVVAVENTHNDAGGRVFPFDDLAPLAALARERGLRLHLDGARLWNAAVASGIPAAHWAEPFDTVSVCLSKGLGAPAGSLVASSAPLRAELLRVRKRLGGGMRQAGILAAAGLHALEHHVERLAEDHAHAGRLAEGLAALGLRVERAPETNIVMFHADDDPPGFWRSAAEAGVRFNPPSGTRLRAVTHQGVDRTAVEDALARLSRCRQPRARA